MGQLSHFLLLEKHTCPWWLAYSWDHRLRRLIHDSKKILNPYLSAGNTVADIGCGMGYFSIAMAEHVGASGKVFAVDIQQKMLDILNHRARKRFAAKPIRSIIAGSEESLIDGALDFMLMFWMLHEVEEKEAFLRHWYSFLKPGGQYLMVEPKIHVSRGRFHEEVKLCKNIGFEAIAHPSVRISRATLFKKTVR